MSPSIKIWILLVAVISISSCSDVAPPVGSYDLNGDGVDDIHYEPSRDGYYEITDRNFDGRMDDSTLFSHEHVPVFSRSDNDFDGRMETVTIFEQNVVQYSYVDTDGNNLFDVVFEYQNGNVRKAHRYYMSDSLNSGARIGEVKFEFGYPESAEMIAESTLSEIDFHESYNPAVTLMAEKK